MVALRSTARLLLAGLAAAAAAAHGDAGVEAGCMFTPATAEDAGASGLIIAADALLPLGARSGHGVHVRVNGTIGAVAPLAALRADYPQAAVLDCGDGAVLTPGFVNAHEHPAYSYALPHPELNPGYVHRDEWRFGLGGKPRLASPDAYFHGPKGDPRMTAALVGMELRHLLGGATTLAGSGGMPGVVRNIGLEVGEAVIDLYDAEADMATFPFSFAAMEALAEECAGGEPVAFAAGYDPNLTFTALVAHVGEGRVSNCAARREVKRFLALAERRDRRYTMVHGVAAQGQDFVAMRETDVTLVWSPRSNLALYGETVDLAAALAAGVRIALSTDWSPSGSFTMREEASCARRVAAAAEVGLGWDRLWRMATVDGAYALGLEDRYGAIAPGMAADLVLVAATGDDPYRAVLAATDEAIVGGWVGGRAVLAAPNLAATAGFRGCEAVGSVAPLVCDVLGDHGLTPELLVQYVDQGVPLTGTDGQAPCDVDARQPAPSDLPDLPQLRQTRGFHEPDPTQELP